MPLHSHNPSKRREHPVKVGHFVRAWGAGLEGYCGLGNPMRRVMNVDKNPAFRPRWNP
jgi:hypothetical protein